MSLKPIQKQSTARKSRRSLLLKRHAREPLKSDDPGRNELKSWPLWKYWEQISDFGILGNPYLYVRDA